MHNEELNTKIAQLELELAQKDREIARFRDIDQLTGLRNMRLLNERISEFGRKAALVADLSRFGTINAVYGTKVADYTLRQVAAILLYNLPSNADLYRFAGDEFVYLFDNPEENQVERFAQQLLGFAAQSAIIYEEIEIRIVFTIGAAYGNGDDQLLGYAMIALQEAKAMGANRFAVYTPEMETFKRQKSNLYWIPRVRQAIENEAIESWYQPIVDNISGKTERYECLARLRDEFGSVIDPYLFLEAAEISGILTAITKSMITQSFSYFEGKESHFSINITDSDFQEGYLEDMLSFRLKKHGLKASQVTLEIVESVRGMTMGSHIIQLTRLKEMGFLIAADDFGVEHSNFARLLAIDLDFIKIDKAFICNLTSDLRSEMIVRNLVKFAQSIGAKTIAEYVSTREIYEKARELGVDYSQGFFFGKPRRLIEESDGE
ncbi:MAG: bifunctional diguanylate cyclase/phosphodiesterase [Helicobacteraceae bacterium]|jgi:diguanylate cyclase (GGDEF)-like protein|nr:bifunctional diguanylate cyclase/phosphodiesterase [Helicobacteraceae bacterium]